MTRDPKVFWTESLCDSKSAPYVLLGVGIAVASVAWGFGVVYIGDILGKLLGSWSATGAQGETKLSNINEKRG